MPRYTGGSYTYLPSAARTATPTKTDITNAAGQSLIVVIDTTAAGVTPSTVFTIQGKDPTSGKYYTILASAAITAVGTVVLRVSPHLTAAANTIAKDVLPSTIAIDAVHGNGTSHTYSVGVMFTP